MPQAVPWQRRSEAERAQTVRLEETYRCSQAAVRLEIEREVCGCDYGGCSWTTRMEAEEIAALLKLAPGRRLLDLGAGAGWPGLYLLRISGCDVTLADLPFAGLKIATSRARRDALPGGSWVVAADAALLPFVESSFDAISHSDLLCCLQRKREVLAACRSVVRSSGTMVFTVIDVAPNLLGELRRRAIEAGPEFVECDTPYPDLLSSTGWRLRDCRDLTAGYGASLRRQLKADTARLPALAEVLGSAATDERLTDWRGKLAALDEGLLRRTLYCATPA